VRKPQGLRHEAEKRGAIKYQVQPGRIWEDLEKRDRRFAGSNKKLLDTRPSPAEFEKTSKYETQKVCC
jgi:hypothetical protein